MYKMRKLLLTMLAMFVAVYVHAQEFTGELEPCQGVYYKYTFSRDCIGFDVDSWIITPEAGVFKTGETVRFF